MERPLITLLRFLLDKSGGLGAGVADTTGLILQSQGLHDGYQAEEVAAHLSHMKPPKFNELTQDTLVETSFVGERHAFYMRWLTGGQHFIYVMATAKTHNRVIRLAMAKSASSFERALGLAKQGKVDSATAVSERLEQPRKFINSKLIR